MGESIIYKIEEGQNVGKDKKENYKIKKHREEYIYIYIYIMGRASFIKNEERARGRE